MWSRVMRPCRGSHCGISDGHAMWDAGRVSVSRLTICARALMRRVRICINGHSVGAEAGTVRGKSDGRSGCTSSRASLLTSRLTIRVLRCLFGPLP